MIKLAILGGTGMAGRDAAKHQEFLENINENYAEITCIAGGSTAGRKYGDVFDEKEGRLADAHSFWEPSICPENLRDIVVDETDVDIITEKADYVISALGSEVASKVEEALTSRGVHVFSNASSFRWHPYVPLMIPEVNHHDTWLLEKQEAPGKHICNPNCTTAGYVPLIHALEQQGYNMNHVALATQQAISGKGDAIADPEYVKSIEGNVKDDWTKNGENAEEWKSSCEPQKILSRVSTLGEVENEQENVLAGKDSKILPIYTQTTRVHVQHGHLEYLLINFKTKVDAETIKQQLRDYETAPEVAKLPTTPKHLFDVLDRMPEPKQDVFRQNGMGVVVGDIKQHSPHIISLYTLTHNLRRGATWAGRQGLEHFYFNYQNGGT